MTESTNWASLFPDLDDDLEIPAILLGPTEPFQEDGKEDPPLTIPHILLPQADKNKRINERVAKDRKQAKRRSKSKQARASKKKNRKR